MEEQYFTGIVLRATGSWYEVMSEGERYQCRIRGKLRLKGVRSTNPVVVGDTVRCLKDESGSHVIIDIEPRRNYVIRRASNLSRESHIIAANIFFIAVSSFLFLIYANAIRNDVRIILISRTFLRDFLKMAGE